MNKIIKNIGCTITFALVLGTVSCRKTAFTENPLGTPALSFEQQNGIYQVPPTNAFEKDLDKISIPVEISLSEAAPANFSVSLVGNTTAAAQAIGSQSLDNTIAIAASNFTVPSETEIRFGIKKVSFKILVPISVIEVNYGKKLAIGIDLVSATKGNAINPQKKTVVVVLHTNDVIAATDVHYVSFATAGIVNTSPTNTTKDALFLSIPLQINMSGAVGKAFSMKLISDPAAVNALIANGSLPNTQLLNDAAISFPPTATIGLNLNSAAIQLSVNIADLLVNYSTKWAFAVTLADPEKYQVLETKKTVVVVIDPLTVLDEITLLLKNTAQPFAFSALEPVNKRWGKLANWTSNDAANTFKGAAGYGSYDANNSTNIAFEAFSPDRPNITNGKIFQTIALPAGKYRFQVTLRSGSNNGTVYAAAVSGVAMPDVTLIPAAALGFIKLTATTGNYSVNFQLASSANVSLGMAATITQNNSFNINNVKLFRVLN